DPGAAFTAVIQLGTTAAVVLFFAKDFARIIAAWFRGLRDAEVRRSLDSRMGWYIGLGTIPIAVLGLVFSNSIETSARNLWLIASALIVFGLVLEGADRVARRSNRRNIDQVTLKDGLGVGFAQALALIPGVSRSGATITAGLLLGLSRESAARFSF